MAFTKHGNVGDGMSADEEAAAGAGRPRREFWTSLALVAAIVFVFVVMLDMTGTRSYEQLTLEYQ